MNEMTIPQQRVNDRFCYGESIGLVVQFVPQPHPIDVTQPSLNNIDEIEQWIFDNGGTSVYNSFGIRVEFSTDSKPNGWDSVYVSFGELLCFADGKFFKLTPNELTNNYTEM